MKPGKKILTLMAVFIISVEICSYCYKKGYVSDRIFGVILVVIFITYVLLNAIDRTNYYK